MSVHIEDARSRKIIFVAGVNHFKEDTLLYQLFEKPGFVGDGLIPTGLILFCGSLKGGKRNYAAYFVFWRLLSTISFIKYFIAGLSHLFLLWPHTAVIWASGISVAISSNSPLVSSS